MDENRAMRCAICGRYGCRLPARPVNDWSDLHKVHITSAGGRCFISVADVMHKSDAMIELFHLSDHLVSSCTGGAYCLVSRSLTIGQNVLRTNRVSPAP